MNLYVIKGHSNASPGAKAYDGTYEHDYTVRAGELLIQHKNTIGFEGSVITDSNDLTLRQIIDFINGNAKRGDYGIDIHFNNNNPAATGLEGFINYNDTAKNKKIATEILTRVSALTGLRHRKSWKTGLPYKYPDESHVGKLGIIENTKIPFFLFEACFLNERDLPVYLAKEKEVWRVVAEVYSENIKTFKITPKNFY